MENLGTPVIICFSPVLTTVGTPLRVVPSIFDGSSNVRLWIARIESILKLQGHTEEAVKINFACSLLDGPALEWWIYAESQVSAGLTSAPVSFMEFATALANYFVPFSDANSAERELSSLTQTGTVDEYIRRFASISLRVQGMSDSERRRLFVRGLKSRTQQEVYRQNPVTYDEARRIAQIYDQTAYVVPAPCYVCT